MAILPSERGEIPANVAKLMAAGITKPSA